MSPSSNYPRIWWPRRVVETAPRKDDFYRVEAFKPSFFGRIAEALSGGSRRR